jgi:hypothetical protein
VAEEREVMRKARTLRDIENHPYVESTHTEWDGCFSDSLGRELEGRWVYLKRGYICPSMECGTIHESSIKACCARLNEARRVTREEVLGGWVTDLTIDEFEAWEKEGES